MHEGNKIKKFERIGWIVEVQMNAVLFHVPPDDQWSVYLKTFGASRQISIAAYNSEFRTKYHIQKGKGLVRTSPVFIEVPND